MNTNKIDIRKLFNNLTESDSQWSVFDARTKAKYHAVAQLLGAKDTGDIVSIGNYRYKRFSFFGDDTYITEENQIRVERLIAAIIGILKKEWATESDSDILKAISDFRLLHGDPSRTLKLLAIAEFASENLFSIDDSLCSMAFMPPDTVACGHYRCVLPYMYVSETKSDLFHAELSEIISKSSVVHYDAIMIHRCPTKESLKIAALMKISGKAVVYETDDDIFNIPDWNMMKPLFKPEHLERAINAINLADIVVTTNQYLGESIITRCKIDSNKVMVGPNLLDVTELHTVSADRQLQERYNGFKFETDKKTKTTKLINRKTGKLLDKIHEDYNPIRIIWAGSPTHDKDLSQATGAISSIINRYGIAVKFYFFGYCPKEFLDVVHGNGSASPRYKISDKYAGYIEYIQGVDFRDYMDVIYEIDPDISLCPLEPHVFNQSKSNIKVLEMGAIGVPSIATAFGPYKFIRDGIDGLLCKVDSLDDWVRNMSYLIENREVRVEMGRQAILTVTGEYSWNSDSQNRKKWDDIFKKIHEVSTGNKLRAMELAKNAISQTN